MKRIVAIALSMLAGGRLVGVPASHGIDPPAGPGSEVVLPATADNSTGMNTVSNVPPTKSMTWRAEWRGWDGLHFDLTRRTPFGEWAGVTNLPPLLPEIGSRKWTPPWAGYLNVAETRMAGKLGAKFAVDAAGYVADEDLGDLDAGVEMRRARVYAKGDCRLVLPVSYELEIGYIPDQFYIENSYIEFRDLGFLGSLKAGQYQVPMTLDNFGSSRDMMFMETAAPLQALAPGVEAGLLFGRAILRERMTWAFGIFTEGAGNDIGEATQDFGRAVARVTGLAVDHRDPDDPGAQRLLHLGISGHVLYAGNESVRYRSRPESHLAPYLIDTGEIEADGAVVMGTEMAWVNGPLCVQGEYVHAWVKGSQEPDVGFHGFYAAASWFLTGESKPYDRRQGVFGRVHPRKALAPARGGWGAWEVVGRFSYVDLNDEAVRGGRMAMGMAGVNWHLHSHIKWRFDYGLGGVKGNSTTGLLNIFQTRLEVDF